jgi:hypothetical protein
LKNEVVILGAFGKDAQSWIPAAAGKDLNAGSPFSLAHYSLYHFFISKNGGALSAAMGAAAKRAHRLQERRSLLRQLNFQAARAEQVHSL